VKDGALQLKGQIFDFRWRRFQFGFLDGLLIEPTGAGFYEAVPLDRHAAVGRIILKARGSAFRRAAAGAPRLALVQMTVTI
jgi:hypothetical protein